MPTPLFSERVLGQLRPWHVILLAGLMRAGLICWAEYQDKYFTVKYTDIDYVVFTDAARFVANGESPYRRSTYRYSPLLAYLLLPNIWLHPAWGKVLFSVSDLVAASLMSYLLLRASATPTLRTAALALWLFNPYTATISTRGSCDVLSVLLLLALLICLLYGRSLVSGLLYGLAVHFRIYPVIYGPAIALFLARRALAQAADGQRASWGLPGRAPGADESRSAAEAGDSSTQAAAPTAAPSLSHVRQRRTGGAAGADLSSTGSPSATGSQDASGDGGDLSGAAAGGRGECALAATGKQGGGAAGQIPQAYQRRGHPSWHHHYHYRHYGGYLAAVRPVALFSLGAASAFAALAALFYLMYGKDFVQEAFLHHLTRKDPRHNFSPYYYPIYLSYGDGATLRRAGYGSGYGSGGSDSNLAGGTSRPSTSSGSRGGDGLYDLVADLTAAVVASIPWREPWRLAMVPQAAAVLAVALRFHADLPAAWLLQTWCFVTLNKVVTAQYFVWYLSLLPLVLPALAAQRAVSAWAMAVAGGSWVVAQLHWLVWAYLLEMRGRSVHLAVWVAGLVFQVASTSLLVLLAMALRRPRRRGCERQGGITGTVADGDGNGGGDDSGAYSGGNEGGKGARAGPPSFLDVSLALAQPRPPNNAAAVAS